MRNTESKRQRIGRKEMCGGFSLLELMLTLVIFLGVAGIVMDGMMQMQRTQGTIANRTEMHSSVRSATEVLQQEIGQAGRVALPPPTSSPNSGGPTEMTTAVALGADPNIPVSKVVTLDSATGVYNGMLLVIDTGDNEETVAVTSLTGKQFTGTFTLAHAANVPVRVDGVFSSGIIPTNFTCGAANCGSDSFHLKMYGDINDDGNMVYVEYWCDVNGGNLWRSVAPIGAAQPAEYEVILPNLAPNPSNGACFQYSELSAGGNTYDVDVSVTLTVQTATPDPQTHVVQKETKALLNVSPRNIYEGYQLAGAGIANRNQPMPGSVSILVPQTPQTP